MKIKKLNFIIYPIKISIIVLIILGIKASSTKTETFCTNENVNKSVNLTTMALFINQEEEAKEAEEALQKYLYDALDSYTGDLTGYGADCPMCSGKLACMSSLNVTNGNNTYNDSTYGTVYIVASSKNLPCGSIIRFTSNKISKEPIIAIVLDRGVTGNNIDFLATSNAYAAKYIGRSSITYDVLRLGWEK